MPPQPKYRRDAALDIARRALREGRVYLTDHFRRRMVDRQVSMQDVEHVIDTGTIHDDPRWDDEHGCWEHVIKGADIGGTDLAIVFAIDEDEDIHLITARDV